ncbi:MAG: HAMP domain-containing sensor histidine kinase [Pseudomonadota bacterium]
MSSTTMTAVTILAIASILLAAFFAYRRWHQRRLQQDGLLSVGLTAASISHSTHTVLMCIDAHAEQLRDITRQETHHQLARTITELCHRAIRINQQTMHLMEQQDSDDLCRDAIAQLRGASALLDVAAGTSLTVAMDASGERVALDLRRSQLDQILINLVINARASRAREVDLIARVIPYLHRGTKEAMLVIDARDDATAAPKKIERREPKDQYPLEATFGGGGLGLSTVERLANLIGGRVDIDRIPGRGSSVTVTLPCRRAVDDGDPGELTPKSTPGKAPEAPRSRDPLRRAC